jgi:hypothetical protein
MVGCLLVPVEHLLVRVVVLGGGQVVREDESAEGVASLYTDEESEHTVAFEQRDSTKSAPWGSSSPWVGRQELPRKELSDDLRPDHSTGDQV